MNVLKWCMGLALVITAALALYMALYERAEATQARALSNTFRNQLEAFQRTKTGHVDAAFTCKEKGVYRGVR